jgi:7-alpha-hydroxysteroid dehydrogenase
VAADPLDLTDRTAIVTGGGTGIGAATARLLAEHGADLVIASRTEAELEQVASSIRDETGRRCVPVRTDVKQEDDIVRMVARTMEEFGQIDILVNNAGGTMPGAITETSVRDLEGAFHWNVATAYALTKAALPHLLASGHGSIVNITSAMGRLRDRGYVAYGTAKAALAHMTRLMAADLAPRVRVNAVAPGSIATSALEMVLTIDELRTEMVDRTPLARLGEIEDIALAVLYLASDAGAFVTGKILEIDGGIEYPNLGLNLPDLEPGR